MDLIAEREGVEPQQRKKWSKMLDAFAALCNCTTCTTGAQHRTLKERPILSGYRWQL